MRCLSKILLHFIIIRVLFTVVSWLPVGGWVRGDDSEQNPYYNLNNDQKRSINKKLGHFAGVVLGYVLYCKG